MDREKKGSSVDGYKSNYCVLDLETTSNFLKSARIIEIGIIRVRDGHVVKVFNKLVNPGIPIPYGAKLKSIGWLKHERIDYSKQGRPPGTKGIKASG